MRRSPISLRVRPVGGCVLIRTCFRLLPPNHNRTYRRRPGAGFDIDDDEVHDLTRPMDKDKAEQELATNIKKATSTDENSPKQKHVRSTCAAPVISISDAPQNVSNTLGITTRPSLSGQDFVSSQFSSMVFRPSRRSLWCIGSSRKDTQSCVMNPFTLLTTYRCIIHRKTIEEAQSQTGWLETFSRTIGHDGGKGAFFST